MRLLKSLLCLLLWPSLVGAAPYVTPDTTIAYYHAPSAFEFPVMGPALGALDLQKYVVSSSICWTAGTSPTGFEDNWNHLNDGYGVWITDGHGSSSSYSPVSFDSTAAGQQAMINNLNFWLAHGFTESDIASGATSTGFYTIRLYATKAGQQFVSKNTMVLHSVCYGKLHGATAFPNAKCILSYPASCGVNAGYFDAVDLFASLNGMSGVGQRAVVNARLSTTLDAIGDENLVLAPTVIARSNSGNIGTGRDLFWRFDAPVRTSVPAYLAAKLTGLGASMTNSWWHSNDELRATVIPNGWPEHTAIAYASGDNIRSTGGLWLDGNGYGPAQDDCEISLFDGDNPAASVNGFSVDDSGNAVFNVESEYLTSQYSIQGGTTANGSWTTLATLPPGSGVRTTMGISGFPLYRLTETENSGNLIVHGYADAVPFSQSTTDTLPSVEDLFQQIADRKQQRPLPSSPGDPVGVGRSLIIYSPSVLLNGAQEIGYFWSAYFAYTSTVVNVSGWSAGDIKQDIAARNSGPTPVSFLLLGDDSDAERFSQPWNADWESIRQSYLASGYVPQWSQKLIPTWYVEDPTPRGEQNMAFFTPYYATDMPYWDVDSDGFLDAVGGRLPFSNLNEVLVYVNKMYQHNWGNYGCQTALGVIGDLNYDDSTDGQIARDAWTDVASTLSQYCMVSPIFQSDIPSDGQRNLITAQRWNSYSPQLEIGFASSSNRSKPCRSKDQTLSANAWQMNWLYSSTAAVVFAGSCGAADFWRTEDPDYGPPIPERFLHSWNGARCWIGPSTGTWAFGNHILGKYFAEELFADPSRPVAESWLIAFNRAKADYPNDQRVTQTADCYLFLGDPLTRMEIQPPIATTVPNNIGYDFALIGNRPNPFHDQTEIVFCTSTQGPVNLDVFDVTGRHVRMLVSSHHDPGLFSYVWDGLNNTNERVSSGVYYYRLRTAEGSKTGKMLKVK